MCQKSKQNLSKWQLCDRNYQLRCLRAMSYPDVTWYDMTCQVIFTKIAVFYEKICFFTWFLERISEKLSCCHIVWCHGIVSHDMTWIGKTCLKEMNKNKKAEEAALKEIRELKRKTETQSCKPKHGSFLTTKEIPQSARWL